MCSVLLPVKSAVMPTSILGMRPLPPLWTDDGSAAKKRSCSKPGGSFESCSGDDGDLHTGSDALLGDEGVQQCDHQMPPSSGSENEICNGFNRLNIHKKRARGAIVTALNEFELALLDLSKVFHTSEELTNGMKRDGSHGETRREETKEGTEEEVGEGFKLPTPDTAEASAQFDTILVNVDSALEVGEKIRLFFTPAAEQAIVPQSSDAAQVEKGEKMMDLLLPNPSSMQLGVGDNAVTGHLVKGPEIIHLVDSPPIIISTKLALKEKSTFNWSLRIRKDGKRWRKPPIRFTHIKRRYLLKLKGGAKLARAPVPKDEDEYLDEVVDNACEQVESVEDVMYEAYSRSPFRMDEEDEEDDQDIEDDFTQMALAGADGWDKPETKDIPTKDIPVQERGCLHKYYFEDDVGLICEECGRVGQDIQAMFLSQNSFPARKVSSVGRVAAEVNPDQTNHENISIPLDVLPSVTMTLHGFYEKTLHPHQKEGFKFLCKNLIRDDDGRSVAELGGCILAHAPGTGKTCLTVSFVQSFLTAFPNGRPLIVAPKIMLKPWQKEFELWNVENIPTYNLNESSTKRKKSRGKAKKTSREHDDSEEDISDSESDEDTSVNIGEKSRNGRLKRILKWYNSRSVLLVSYNLFAILVQEGLNDENVGSVKQGICKALLDGPQLLILDEGHFSRTKRTKISQALMRVRTNRKILLSGTLFQNNFKELFNVLKLTTHHFMSSCPEFGARLKAIERKRPPASDGDAQFAGRTTHELNLVGRDSEEQMFIEDIGSKLEEFVDGAGNFDEANLALRKLRALTAPVVHWYAGKILDSLPGLSEFVVYLNLTGHQQKLYSNLTCKSSFEEKTRISEVCIHPALLKSEGTESASTAIDVHHEDPSRGCKTTFILKLLSYCQNCGEKVLIFCQTLSPLDLIERMLANLMRWSKGTEFLRLDGTMSADDRQNMIEQFNNNSRSCVMLASITACKEGISLVGASRVVILDVLYNPSVVRQAVSRAFRIGQKKKVIVYRLVAANTKEEKMVQDAVHKDWLSRVLTDQSFNLTSNSFKAGSILQIEKAPEDSILQKIQKSDTLRRIDRICRYNSQLSRVT